MLCSYAATKSACARMPATRARAHAVVYDTCSGFLQYMDGTRVTRAAGIFLRPPPPLHAGSSAQH
eukprot:5256523-Pleurochrysis_carterae.AAC.4